MTYKTHIVSTDLRGKIHYAHAYTPDKGYMAGVEVITAFCNSESAKGFLKTNRPVDCMKCHEQFGHAVDGSPCDCALVSSED